MMKIKRALLPLALVLVLLLPTSCSAGKNKDKKNTEPVNTVLGTTNALQNTAAQGAGQEDQDVFEPQVIYDAGGITVTVTEHYERYGTKYVCFQIKNTSDISVYVTTEQMSINGYMAPRIALAAGAARGKTTGEALRINSGFLSKTGIETVAELKFFLIISDAETDEVLATTDLITVRLSKSNFETPKPLFGITIYDADGLKITASLNPKSMQPDPEKTEYELQLQMENTSNRTIRVSLPQLTVNGVDQQGVVVMGGVMRDDTVAGISCTVSVPADEQNIQLEIIVEVTDYETGEKLIVTPLLIIHPNRQ